MKYIYILLWVLNISYGTACFGGDSDSAKERQPLFTGVITYDVVVESKNPLVTNQLLSGMYGRTMKMYFGPEGYKLIFEGDSSIEVLYLTSENRQYLKIGANDSLLWRTAENYDSKFIATRSNRDATI